MLAIVFVLGRPGSGKSTGAHHLAEVAWQQELSAIRIGDYRILYQWFEEDTQEIRFKSAGHGGFDVIKFEVLDEALQELRSEVEQRIRRISRREDQLIIIEFARNNYCKALDFFGPEILKGAHFVYVEADVPTCIEHIRRRTFCHETPDNHFVSENIMRTYYSQDDGALIPHYLWGTHRIPQTRFRLVKNTGTLESFTQALEPVIAEILSTAARKKASAISFHKLAERTLAGVVSCYKFVDRMLAGAGVIYRFAGKTLAGGARD